MTKAISEIRTFFISNKLWMCPLLFLLLNSCRNHGQSTEVITSNVSGIAQTRAESGGVINAGNRTITAKGICWAETTDPSLDDNKTDEGTGNSDFVSILTNLQPGTEYFVRAYVIFAKDTIYGRNVSFSTEEYPTITDFEGNTYNVIRIGNQTWMAENLRAVKYNDGKPIPMVTDESKWESLSTPAYCWYKNEEESYKQTYGTLYNWYSVNTGKLCPTGWHVPTDAEWTELSNFLGGEKIAGGKLKDTGTIYWVDPNTGATNESGFTAFPGGFRYYDGKFFDFGFSGYWWSSGQYSSARAFFRFLYYNESTFYRFDNLKRNGFSVRCLKD